MKSTFSHLSSFWVKVLPVMLVLLSIGLTRTQAQNYKPFSEAIASVSGAIENLQHDGSSKATVVKSTSGNGQATTGSVTPAQASTSQQKTFDVLYFDLFIEKAKLAESIAQGVIDLDATINAQGQPAARVTLINTARAHLMALITN